MHCRLLLLLLALVVAPAEHPFRASALHGQAPKQSPVHPVRVTVALVDRLPPLRQEYPAVILRHAGGGDLILLPRATASGELLDAAVRSLLLARAAQGNFPSTHRGQRFGTMTLGVGLRRHGRNGTPRSRSGWSTSSAPRLPGGSRA